MAEGDDETQGTLLPQSGRGPLGSAATEVGSAATETPGGITGVRRPVARQLGRYVIRGLLGKGGVGAVYEADDPELHRRVAIKVLREDRAGDTEGLRREAQALALLVHPNVMTVYDVGVADGEVYVVMQLIEGYQLDVWLRERAATPAQILDAYRQAGQGLAAAHDAKLVHCDFKPANVLVDKQGVVRVTDFGLARSGHQGDAGASGLLAIAGTPAYMAPEQFEGIVLAASDQFAFCVALWETLAGQRPFDDPSIAVPDPERVRARVLRRERANLPPHVLPVLERGLAPRAEDRYPSLRDLLAALEPPREQRARWPVVLGGLALVAAATVAVVLSGAPPPPPSAPAAALPPAVPAVHTPWAGADVAAAHALTHYGSDACAYSPTVAGSDVVFDRTQLGEVDLFSIPLAGGEPRALTHAQGTWEWRAQPGRRPGEVVHLVHNPDHDQEGANISYLDLATGSETIATSLVAWDAAVVGGSLVYSPDSATELRALTGTRETTIAQAPEGHDLFQFSASPKGDRLVANEASEDQGICLVDLVKHETHCRETRSSAARPAFGADGSAVYFNAPDGVRRVDLATGDEDVIVPGLWTEGGFAVTPDGSALLYSACSAHSEAVDLETGQRVVPDPTAQYPAAGPRDELAWTHVVDGIAVLTVRHDGREIDVTQPAQGSVIGPQPSPDGTKVAFIRTGGKERDRGIFVTDLSSSDTSTQVTNDLTDTGIAWLDADHLAFTRLTANVGHIFSIDLDGSAIKQLSPATRTVYGTRGKELLVSGNDKLYWLDASTGHESPGPAKPAGNLMWAEISPNGKWLLYQMGTLGRDLWRAQLDAPTAAGRAPVLIKHYDAAYTTNSTSIGSITDDGHALVAPGRWSGDIFVVPAKPGWRF